MITYNFIIVEVEEEYDNVRNNLVVNIDRDNASFITRKAKVISAPSFTCLQEGDEVICHHNIFRIKGAIKGNEIKSDFHMFDKTYRVPLTECFMYRRNGSDWVSLSPYCFVEPIKEETSSDNYLLSHQEHQNKTHKGYKKLTGILRYPCKELMSEKDAVIIFSEYSEYEFIIDGKLYYKMSTKDILAKAK